MRSSADSAPARILRGAQATSLPKAQVSIELRGSELMRKAGDSLAEAEALYARAQSARDKEALLPMLSRARAAFAQAKQLHERRLQVGRAKTPRRHRSAVRPHAAQQRPRH